jgi:hypothetical protein
MSQLLHEVERVFARVVNKEIGGGNIEVSMNGLADGRMQVCICGPLADVEAAAPVLAETGLALLDETVFPDDPEFKYMRWAK